MLEKDYIVEIVDDFKNLNLEYNEITNIKENSFIGLHNLISNNQISEIKKTH